MFYIIKLPAQLLLLKLAFPLLFFESSSKLWVLDTSLLGFTWFEGIVVFQQTLQKKYLISTCVTPTQQTNLFLSSQHHQSFCLWFVFTPSSSHHCLKQELVLEDDWLCHFHQRVQAIRWKFPCKHVWICRIWLSKIINQLWRNLRRMISMWMTINCISPIHICQCILGTTIRILHW